MMGKQKFDDIFSRFEDARHKIGHFGDVISCQSLDLDLDK